MEKKPKRIIIIGGIAAGTSAAAKARRLDENAEIIIYEKDRYISYGTCGLPYFVSGKIENLNKLLINTPSSFEKRFNIKVNTLHEVLEILPARKSIKVMDMKKRYEFTDHFDRLIIATGSQPVRPWIEGSNATNVFGLKNIDDALDIKKYLQNIDPDRKRGKAATVIGGGFIGLEMLEAFGNYSMKVDIIEKTSQLLPIYDRQIIEYLENYLLSKGINIFKEDEIIELKQDKKGLVKKVLTKSGKEFDTDLVVYSVGARPNSELARKCGIKTGDSGAIIVNQKMETNFADIYAAGDCCECRNLVSGINQSYNLASIANRQGWVAGYNSAGGDAVFEGSVVTSIIKVLDVSIAKTGLSFKEAVNSGINAGKIELHYLSHAGYYPGAEMIHMILIYDKSTENIKGFEAIGRSGVDKKLDIVSMAIRLKLKTWQLSDIDFGYQPAFGSARDSINMFGMIASNLKEKQVDFTDVEEVKEILRLRKKMQLLDVRSEKEYEAGHIEESIHIHIDELRDNLQKLDKEIKTVVYCRTGYRAYLGLRILKNNNFKDVSLLNGSYMSWERKI